MSPSRRTTLLRLGLLAVIVAGLLVLARIGLGDRFTAEGLRELVRNAGTGGALVFIGVFALGQLAYVPGTLFYVASVFAYGRGWGLLVSYVASLVSVTISFWFVRAIGGQPLAEIKNARVRRLLGQLDERPFVTMLILRIVFWTAPALNYAFALSQVRFRTYFAATAAGLVLPLIGISALYGVFFH